MRIRPFALLALAACTSTPAADPTSPNDPPSTTKPATPVSIAGEWIDTAGWQVPGAQPNIWHITQVDSIVTIVDTLWYDSPIGWERDECVPFLDNGTLCGTTGLVAGDTLYVDGRANADAAIIVGSTMTFGPATAFVPGTWEPPAAPTSVALNGVYMSDSLPWTALGEPCLGTIQIDLVIDKAGPGYPNAPAGGYMSTEYDRQCGSNWQDAIASWVVIDSGRVSNGVLSLAENELPSGYTGPFTSAGNNWQFQVVSNDSLADITPSSINLGWRPPAFVYQPAGFYASVNAVALSRRASGRRSRP